MKNLTLKKALLTVGIAACAGVVALGISAFAAPTENPPGVDISPTFDNVYVTNEITVDGISTFNDRIVVGDFSIPPVANPKSIFYGPVVVNGSMKNPDPDAFTPEPLLIDDDVVVQGDVDVNGVDASGALDVAGVTTLSGVTNIEGNLVVGDFSLPVPSNPRSIFHGPVLVNGYLENPDPDAFTPQSLLINDDVDLQGNMAVRDIDATGNINTVTGDIGTATGDLSAPGGMVVGDSLSALSGGVTAPNGTIFGSSLAATNDIATVNGNLISNNGLLSVNGDVISQSGNVTAANGTVTANALNITGNATINGNLTVNGNVDIGSYSYVSSYVDVAVNAGGIATVTCPADTQRTGCGFGTNYYTYPLIRSYPTSTRSCYAQGRNYATSTARLTVYAICHSPI